MLNESVIMLSLVVASLTPLKTNYHAKNDKPEDAVYMHSAYKAIPKDSSVNETDVYTLNFYKEKEYKEITPIVQYCKLKRALEEQELSFTLEQTIEKTFSETSIVSNALSLTAGGGIDLGNIATVGAELELNANNTYKNTFHFSKSQTVTTTSTYKIDGVKYKFGYYALFEFSEGAYDTYCFYQHRKIANYGQMEMYQTLLLDETSDCHVRMPKDCRKTFVDIKWFETLDDYVNYCERYNFKS